MAFDHMDDGRGHPTPMPRLRFLRHRKHQDTHHVVTVALRCERVAVAVADPPIARIAAPNRTGMYRAAPSIPATPAAVDSTACLRVRGRSHRGQVDRIPRANELISPGGAIKRITGDSSQLGR